MSLLILQKLNVPNTDVVMQSPVNLIGGKLPSVTTSKSKVSSMKLNYEALQFLGLRYFYDF